jgi:hypothetical protein
MGRKIKAKKVATPGSGVGVHKGSSGRPRKMKKTTSKKFKRLGYSQERLDNAILLVKEKTMMLGKASRHFEIPKTTIFDRMNSKKTKLELGWPTVLSEEEENIIVQRLLVMWMWGFPLTSLDVRFLVKSYLEDIGRTCTRQNSFKVPCLHHVLRESLFFYTYISTHTVYCFTGLCLLYS